MGDDFGSGRQLFYDKTGAPIDWRRLVELRMEPGYERVARTEIGPVVVSTTWIAQDHRHVRGGPPLIFETKVFPGEQSEDIGDLDDFTYRYATEPQARAGHEQVCELIRAMSGDERKRASPTRSEHDPADTLQAVLDAVDGLVTWAVGILGRVPELAGTRLVAIPAHSLGWIEPEPDGSANYAHALQSEPLPPGRARARLDALVRDCRSRDWEPDFEKIGDSYVAAFFPEADGRGLTASADDESGKFGVEIRVRLPWTDPDSVDRALDGRPGALEEIAPTVIVLAR